MGIYKRIYKTLNGTGIGNHVFVEKLREAVVYIITRAPLRTNGYLLQLDKRDSLGFLVSSNFEPEITKLISKDSKGIGLDLGANIGYYSLLMASKGCDKVYAFEPASYNFNILKKNIAINHLADKIIAENKAVSNKSGTALFNLNRFSSTSNSFVHQGSAQENTEKVETITLDEYFKNKEKPYIIKMDVEGWEKEAIEGGTSVFHSAKIIIFENNIGLLNKRKMDPHVVLSMFKKMGFNLRKIEGEAIDNYIAIKKM